MTSPEGINVRGAVDLSALASPPPGDTPAPAGGLVVDATAATFNEVIQQSQTVPVVVDLYSSRSPASAQLSATLQELTAEYNGKFLLVRVNADTEPDIVAAFGIQALPTTVALIKTQPVPLFQGVHEAEQIRQVLDELLRVAAENGVSGTVAVEEQSEPAPEPPLPPHIQEAYDAIERQDLDAAIAAFKQGLANNPADAEAKAGLAQVELLKRLKGVDPAAALTAARDGMPGDLPLQLTAADVEVSMGQLSAGFDRLLAAIQATTGEERETARARLVELFLLAPEGSAEVAQARKKLALALF